MAKPTTVPIWDSTAINITTPVGEQTYGWGVSQAPPAQVFNWLHHWTYQWVNWLNSVAGMVADAWAWTGRHSFIRSHVTESTVQISNTGGGEALLVIGPTMADEINASSIVATRVTSINTGVAGTITNSDGANTDAALEVVHAGRLALNVDGNVNVTGGTHTVQGTITSLLGHMVSITGNIVATTGNVNAPAGGVYGATVTAAGVVSGATVTATGQCGGNTVVSTTTVSGKVGVFTGIQVFGSERGGLCVPCVTNAQRPDIGVAGDIYITSDGTDTRLWHCDAPSQWSYHILNRAY